MSITPSVAVDTFKKSFMSISNGKTLYVGGTGEDNYTKIQDAIDNASDGDTIFVYDESSPYEENIVINKSISLFGEDMDTTVIDGTYSFDSIYINASNVKIKGFTIINGDYYGIQLLESKGCLITGNKISNNDIGIEIVESSGNIITSNIILNNLYSVSLSYSGGNTITCNNISNTKWEDGISLWRSNNNTINGNNIISSELYGIELYKSSGNIITGNNIISNNKYGIEIEKSRGNIITKNNINSNNDYGISLDLSNNNTIRGNNISKNYGGIDIEESRDNYISDNNIISNNRYGIIIDYSNYNNITANNIIFNKAYGIVLIDSDYNTILKNNLIFNKRNAYFITLTSPVNQWDQNYWNRPRILPKIIFGKQEIWSALFCILIPSYTIDWRPALKPYNIEVVI